MPGTVVVGEKSDAYACAHTNATPNSNLIAILTDRALDADAAAIFGQRIFAMPAALSMIRRACEAIDDEQFHSRVFEVFDYVSNVSTRTRAGRDRHVLRVQRIKRFIEHHAGERIALADVASAVALSPFACLRIFKHATGLTPAAYLTACRMQEATRLLKQPNLEIRDIAERCGFASQAYFARFFRNYTGLAPSEFRRQALR
jgi:AraC-like DNA-binding protein